MSVLIEYKLPFSNSSILFSVILGHTPTVQDPGEEDGGADRVCPSEWRDAEVLSHCSPPDFSQPLQPLYCSKSCQVIQHMSIHAFLVAHSALPWYEPEEAQRAKRFCTAIWCD